MHAVVAVSARLVISQLNVIVEWRSVHFTSGSLERPGSMYVLACLLAKTGCRLLQEISSVCCYFWMHTRQHGYFQLLKCCCPLYDLLCGAHYTRGVCPAVCTFSPVWNGSIRSQPRTAFVVTLFCWQCCFQLFSVLTTFLVGVQSLRQSQRTVWLWNVSTVNRRRFVSR